MGELLIVRIVGLLASAVMAASVLFVSAPAEAADENSLMPFIVVDPSTGIWRIYQPIFFNEPMVLLDQFYYGNPSDYPFAGDWDCDGVDTPGLYRQSDGFVYLRNSNTQGIADTTFFFGNPGDVPFPGDFNGDGCDTISIFRPSEQRFYIINTLGQNGGGLGAAEYSFIFGDTGDLPVAGDWDGDGIDTPGVYRDEGINRAVFYFRNSNTQGVADITNVTTHQNLPGPLTAGPSTKTDTNDNVGFNWTERGNFWQLRPEQDGGRWYRIPWSENWIPVMGDFGYQDRPPPPTEMLVFKQERNLSVMRTDGTVSALTDGNDLDWNPNWHPSGENVLFYRDDLATDGINDGLYVVNREGPSNPQRILNDRYAGEGDYAPDGIHIVFVSTRISASNPASRCGDDPYDQLFCDSDLFIYNILSGAIQQLTALSATNYEVAWSPDGSMIAFTSDLDNDWEIFTINTDGTGLTQRTFNADGDHSAAWHPDSSGIVYSGYVDGQSEIWSLRFGSPEVRLTNNPARDDYPAVASDGTIAFARAEGTGVNSMILYTMSSSGTNEKRTGVRGYMPDWRP